MLIPPRHIPKIILATAFAPLVVKNLKPILKAAGRGLVKVGDLVERLADEVEDKKAPAEPMQQESVAPEVVPEASEVVPETAQDSPVGDEDLVTTTSDAEEIGEPAVDEPTEFVPPTDDVVLEPEVEGTPEATDTPNEA